MLSIPGAIFLCGTILCSFFGGILFQKGQTPLHLACQRRHIPISLILIHSGCNMDLLDAVSQRLFPIGFSVCNVSLTDRLHSFVFYFRMKSLPCILPAGKACCLSSKPCVLLVAKWTSSTRLISGKLSRIPVEFIGYSCFCVWLFQAGLTALHLGAKMGHTEVVRCLLLSGADPDMENKVISV